METEAATRNRSVLMHAELQTLHASIAPVSNARRSWTTRTSVRLILHDGSRRVGLGEAAPLLGLSPETATEARRALERVAWPDRAPTSIADVRAIVDTIDANVPSARFAAETALMSLMASTLGVPLWALFQDEASELPVATALLANDLSSLEAAAKEAAALGVQAVKVKVGRTDTQTERALLTIVRDALPEAELRLDANGSIDPRALDERLAELADFHPAFIEEPMPLPAMLAHRTPAPFPFAVDESLAGDAEAHLEKALACDAIGAVVLKPTLLGGLGACWQLAQKARRAGRKVVVSHLLEGVIARAAAAHLAVVIGPDAAGLGEHPALDPLSDGLHAGWIDAAWIEPPETPGLGLDVVW